MNIPFVDMARLHGGLRPELLDAFARVLDSGAYVQSSEVASFEREFAASTGARHALAVSNGTTALHLALLACGVRPGDEVITVANTFIATVEAIMMTGATPIFVDVDPETMLMDPVEVERCITHRTRVILPVHLYGRVCDMDALTAIAHRHGLYVVEDACQAHGATLNGRQAGTMGDLGCLSFYPTKNLGTVGEGGAVLTNEPALAARVESLRNHGQSAKNVHTEPGYNYRMPELQAAALRVLLPHLEAWNRSRVAAAGWYARGLSNLDIEECAPAPSGSHVYHLYVVRSGERAELQRFLAQKGIGTAIHYPTPIHMQPAYVTLGMGRGNLPRTEHAVDRILSLPMHPSITEEEVVAVCTAIREFERSRASAPVAMAVGGAS